MADVIRKATNRFTKGLVMDFSPENTKNEVLTHALNATLLTFNGNELSLQNDMGNARVETAYLPEGYMPVGTCEYGGIIYIVSYNPLEDKSQIGCFPSPERNISNKELGVSDAKILKDSFQNFTRDLQNKWVPDGTIKNNTQYVLLKNDNLNPGDKFLICANKEIYDEKLTDLLVDRDAKYYPNTADDPKGFELVKHPILALNVVSIEESGKIVYLNSDIRQYTTDNSYTKDGVQYTDTFKYHILGEMAQNGTTYEQATVDPDSYRNVLSSGYSVFKSKTSGRLAILAELVMIDSYSVTHSVQPRKDESGKTLDGYFDVVIHTEITPEVTSENYNTVPKLQYYYLNNSQGYLQATDINGHAVTQPLYVWGENQDTGEEEWGLNSNFFGTKLSQIYEPTIKDSMDLSKNLSQTGAFNFPRPGSYHGRMVPYDGELSAAAANKVYTKFTEGKYHRMKKSQIINNFQNYYINQIQAKFYKYSESEHEYEKVAADETISNTYTYYVKVIKDVYHDVKRDTAYQNAGKTLYKLTSEPLTATDKELSTETIEKFQYVEIISYRRATEDELHDGTKLYVKVGDQFIEFKEKPETGGEYYVFIVETTLKSIGTGVIDREDYIGDIYYYPTTKDYVVAEEKDEEIYWDFTTYPKESEEPYGCPISLYWKEEIESYRPATETELINYKDLDIELWYSTEYIYIHPDNMDEYLDSHGTLFMVVPIDTYASIDRFVPNASYNYIEGYDKPKGFDEPADGYPKDDPISLYTVADFIPTNTGDDTSLQYEDLKLANIKIPGVVSVNGLDLPFKYDYSIVPCMNYGRLQHLQVSNTVDFSKLHAFAQSGFSTWKYHIDESQLRLTFGADIYDTYETDKVDALVLEFYDLWGFAGSIEISDKKSYNGIFTKLIPLNSLNALSKKRVAGSNYIESFKRNINIQPSADDGFVFNSKPVEFCGATVGWRYTDGADLEGDDNDCGTLYSNVVYGVKTYLRQKVNESYVFTENRNFFLYTLPIYNDYYYTVNDFSQLSNPQLDLLLTYKIQDAGTKIPYTSEDGTSIVNGYSTSHRELVNAYHDNSLEGYSSLDLVKYYKYTGTSNISLEIGLKPEYQALNLSYSSELNNYYKCKLYLTSIEDKSCPYEVASDDEVISTPENILNYYSVDGVNLSMDLNKIGFGSNKTVDFAINNNFNRYNFINFNPNLPQDTISLNYEFVVGYKVNVTNIRSTEVQATTVCALLHKTEGDELNYEDFGVYKYTDEDGNSRLLSSAILYNSGQASEEMFGVCRFVNPEATTMSTQCQSYDFAVTDASPIKTAGKFNTGEPLKQISQHIGKYTFCQPHASGFSESEIGVNVYKQKDGSYAIGPDYGGWKARDQNIWHDDDYDDAYGLIPKSDLEAHPLYSLTLNTKNMLNYYSEFITTLDYKTKNGGQTHGYDKAEDVGPVEHTTGTNVKFRVFTGFNGSQLETFNTKLMKSMSQIYAYNPDYNSLAIKVGDVVTENTNPRFESNLINTYSEFIYPGNKTFNDFIYLGPICYMDYLNWMHTYSEDIDGKKFKITTIDDSGNEVLLSQISFIPGFDFCGMEEAPYLVSSLTYRVPTPDEINSEFNFQNSTSLVVKHSDGSTEYLEGIPNKKALYAFDSTTHKLIQLDVSNYTVQSDGSIKLAKSTTAGSMNSSVELNDIAHKNAWTNGYDFIHKFKNDDDTEDDVKLRLTFYSTGTDLATGDDYAYCAQDRYSSMYNDYLYIQPNIIGIGTTDSNYNYTIKITDVEVTAEAKILDGSKISTYHGYTLNGKYVYGLMDQTAVELKNLVSDATSYFQLKTTSGGVNSPTYNSTYWISSEPYDHDLKINGSSHSYKQSYSNPAALSIDTYVGSVVTSFVDLYQVRISKVWYTIERKIALNKNASAVVKTTRTSKYYDNTSTTEGYKVLGNFQSACFRGTSITVNDLIYEPNQTGHRLYIRGDAVTNPSSPRSVIFYRNMTDRQSWVKGDTNHKNCLYIQTGPCFTTKYNSL